MTRDELLQRLDQMDLAELRQLWEALIAQGMMPLERLNTATTRARLRIFIRGRSANWQFQWPPQPTPPVQPVPPTPTPPSRRWGDIGFAAAIMGLLLVFVVILMAIFRWGLAPRGIALAVPEAVEIPVSIAPPKTVEVPVKVEVEVEKKVVEVATEPSPTPTLVPPAPTPVPPAAPPVSQACLFDLRKSIRGLPGVSLINDRGDWDGKANGLVSFVVVDCTTATFHFERWGPPGSWTNLEETKEVTWGTGNYNLQELFYPSGEKDLNDTLQTVLVQPGGQVELREHDEAPWGIKITLICPTDP